jgi:GTP-binding protein
VEDYEIINRELAMHAAELAERPQIVVGNKADVIGIEDADERLRARAHRDGRPYFAVSAVTGEGVDALVRAVAERVFDLRSEAASPATFEQVWAHDRSRDRGFTVRNLGGGVFRVEGRAIERMVIMTEWENEEALAFLQKRLVRAGVEAALIDAGARDGDEIRIVERSFEFDIGLADDPEVDYIEDEPAESPEEGEES